MSKEVAGKEAAGTPVAKTPAPSASGKKDGRSPTFKLLQPFFTGGAAGCVATAVIQPIDMIKVRIQISGETVGASKNPLVVGRDIIAKQGMRGLYKGLDAALVRQLTYTTTRMGVFRTTSNYLKGDAPASSALPFYKKAIAGSVAGAVGAFVGNPADLALIRMQADATLPVAQRRNYTGIFNAICTIVKGEGITGLWKGCTPTVTRAVFLNMGMLSSYDQTKEYLSKLYGDGWSSRLLASAAAGFVASAMSLPFDFAKTRIQKQIPDAAGNLKYKGTFDCLMKVTRTEGVLACYAGFPTFYVRIAPHAMLVLLISDYADKYIANYMTK